MWLVFPISAAAETPDGTRIDRIKTSPGNFQLRIRRRRRSLHLAGIFIARMRMRTTGLGFP